MFRSLTCSIILAATGLAAACGCSSLPFQKSEAEELTHATEAGSWQERLARLKKRGMEREQTEDAVVEFQRDRGKKKKSGAPQRSSPEELAAKPAAKTLAMGRWVRPKSEKTTLPAEVDVAEEESLPAEETIQVVKHDSRPPVAEQEDVDEPKVLTKSDRLAEQCRRLASLTGTPDSHHEPEQPVSYSAPAAPVTRQAVPVVATIGSGEPPQYVPAHDSAPVHNAEELAPVVMRTSSGATVPENSLRRYSRPAVSAPAKMVAPQSAEPVATVRPAAARDSAQWDRATLRPIEEVEPSESN